MQNIKITLSDEGKRQLDRNITKAELKEAMLSLKNSKSPGMDGLVKEFYEFFWDDLEDLYYEVVQNIFETGELSSSQKEGVIKTTYKKNGRHLLKNYRPISLLNVDCKIIAKCLAKKMAVYLKELIHEDQKCVPGRKITKNIHIVQDLIDAICNDDDVAALILIDQEKAFDRISHKFMIKT